MSASSRLRREGRNAFYRGGNPADHNPYAGDGAFAMMKAHDWLVGWQEAEREDKEAIAREAAAETEEEAKIEEFARLYNLAKDRGLIS
jgi:hypothetical protein